MSRPLIGLNCRYTYDKEDEDEIYVAYSSYLKSIAHAGGTPVVLPLFPDAGACRDALDRVDGLVLTGGADINPQRWGEKKHPKVKLLNPKKEASDFILASEAIRRDKPVLGICYGCQLVDVALGGSLHQHLPELEGVNRTHAMKNKGKPTHPACVVASTRLKDIMGIREARVNSYHHQGIKTLGQGLEITACADDGVIEGVESSKHRFLVTVQWHPERIQSDRPQRRLFEALVTEASK